MKILLALLLLSPAAALAEPAPLTHPLTSEEVACNRAQLNRLLNRLSLSASVPETASPTRELAVTYSNERAFYEGLGIVGQDFFSGQLTPEYELAFNLNPSLRDLLANPARPPLPQISLSREAAASNFVKPTNPHAFTLLLNPRLSGTPSAADLLLVKGLRLQVPGLRLVVPRPRLRDRHNVSRGWTLLRGPRTLSSRTGTAVQSPGTATHGPAITARIPVHDPKWRDSDPWPRDSDPQSGDCDS